MLLTGNSKTTHSILLWQLESEPLYVVIDVRYVGKLQVNEALISASERFGRFLAFAFDLFRSHFYC